MKANRFWRLDARPLGNTDFDEALSLCEEAVGPLPAGQVRVRVDYLSMDAGTRMWMSPRTDGYQPPLPLGAKMVGLCLGEVVESDTPAYPVGAMVRGFGQWAELATVDPVQAALEIVDDEVRDPRQHFGALGMNAWTAYVGVREVALVKPGERLVVSAAAGATGSLACQVGRKMGARVIGIAGGPDKCAWLRETIGVDIVIDYRSEDVAARLAGIDGGVHAFFDNVGGPILDAVLPNMAHYGRVAICGMVAGYDNDAPMPGPANFDQILMRRLRVEGFFIPDFLERGAEFMPQLRAWYEEGSFVSEFDETVGIENVLVAYERMLTGKNIGKAIVRL